MQLNPIGILGSYITESRVSTTIAMFRILQNNLAHKENVKSDPSSRKKVINRD